GCRARIDAGLANADPCVAYVLDPSDLERGSDAQLDAVAAKKKSCDARRERAIHEAKCADLVAHVEGGTLDAGDPAGSARPFLERMAKRSLDPADLAVDPSFPCDDVGSSARLWPVFVKAAAASTPAWRSVATVSPKLAETLRTKGPALDPAALDALNDR